METFLMLTPDQFQQAYNDFLDKIDAERRERDTLAWQVARWQVWRTLAPPDKKQISVFDLIELPGDEHIKREKTEKIKPSSAQRFMELEKKWT